MPFTIVQCYAMRLLAKVVAVFIPMVLLASHSTHSPLEVNRLRQNWLPILLLFILTL